MARHIGVHFPLWLENLLGVVRYNFAKGVFFFCIHCSKAPSQEEHFDEYHWLKRNDYESSLFREEDFAEGARHYGHPRLRLYDKERSISVHSADIKVFGVDTEDVEQTTWSVSNTDSELFVFLNNSFGYFHEKESIQIEPSFPHCAHCRTRLKSIEDNSSPVKFCCLECKFQFESLWPALLNRTSPSIPNARSPARLADESPRTYAQTTREGEGSSKSPTTQKSTRVTNRKQHSSSNIGPHSAGCPQERCCCHIMASESSQESDVSILDRAEDDDGSSVLYANVESDLDAAFDEYQLASELSPRDVQSKAPWKQSQLGYGFQVESESDEIKSFRSLKSKYSELERVWNACISRKCKPVRPLRVVVPAVGTDFSGTMVCTNRLMTERHGSCSPKCERITDVGEHFNGTFGYGEHVGYRAPEQYFGTGSDQSSCKSDAIVHDGLQAWVEHVPEGPAEVDQTGLPEVLFDDQEHVLLSPSDDILSVHITTPHRSPTSSTTEGIFTAELSSFPDSEPLMYAAQRKKRINSVLPECMTVPSARSLHTALAAASCSNGYEWRRQKVSAVRNLTDWDVEPGQEMEAEGLGLMPNCLNDIVLRKVPFLLGSSGSNIENDHRINPDEDDTKSEDESSGSSLSGGTGPEFPFALPVVESFKIGGSVDVTSLKDLLSTFDPKSWTSTARH